MEVFAFDDARRLAETSLKRYRSYRDFEDLVSETVLYAWRASQRHPELPLSALVISSARYTVRGWFADGRCGDVVGRKGKGRVPVFTMRWNATDDEQMESEECGAVVPDFTEALIERLDGRQEDPNEGEIVLTGWERRKQQQAEKRQRTAEMFARCREEEIRYGQWLLTEPELMTHHREAIRLRYIEGLSMNRVSQLVGLHWTTIYTAAKNARRRLEKQSG